METNPPKRRRRLSIAREVTRRIKDTSKLVEIETRKLAVAELVAEKLDEISELLRANGFKLPSRRVALPGGVTVVREQEIPTAAPVSAVVKNPCALCGKEAVGTEDLPNGQKKYLCRPHFQQRMKEKQEEAAAQQLLGRTGTNFQRTKPPAAPVDKILIQADGGPVDPLKGAIDTAEPPLNNVLE